MIAFLRRLVAATLVPAVALSAFPDYGWGRDYCPKPSEIYASQALQSSALWSLEPVDQYREASAEVRRMAESAYPYPEPKTPNDILRALQPLVTEGRLEEVGRHIFDYLVEVSFVDEPIGLFTTIDLLEKGLTESELEKAYRRIIALSEPFFWGRHEFGTSLIKAEENLARLLTERADYSNAYDHAKRAATLLPQAETNMNNRKKEGTSVPEWVEGFVNQSTLYVMLRVSELAIHLWRAEAEKDESRLDEAENYLKHIENYFRPRQDVSPLMRDPLAAALSGLAEAHMYRYLQKGRTNPSDLSAAEKEAAEASGMGITGAPQLVQGLIALENKKLDEAAALFEIAWRQGERRDALPHLILTSFKRDDLATAVQWTGVLRAHDALSPLIPYFDGYIHFARADENQARASEEYRLALQAWAPVLLPGGLQSVMAIAEFHQFVNMYLHAASQVGDSTATMSLLRELYRRDRWEVFLAEALVLNFSADDYRRFAQEFRKEAGDPRLQNLLSGMATHLQTSEVSFREEALTLVKGLYEAGFVANVLKNSEAIKEVLALITKKYSLGSFKIDDLRRIMASPDLKKSFEEWLNRNKPKLVKNYAETAAKLSQEVVAFSKTWKPKTAATETKAQSVASSENLALASTAAAPPKPALALEAKSVSDPLSAMRAFTRREPDNSAAWSQYADLLEDEAKKVGQTDLEGMKTIYQEAIKAYQRTVDIALNLADPKLATTWVCLWKNEDAAEGLRKLYADGLQLTRFREKLGKNFQPFCEIMMRLGIIYKNLADLNKSGNEAEIRAQQQASAMYFKASDLIGGDSKEVSPTRRLGAANFLGVAHLALGDPTKAAVAARRAAALAESWMDDLRHNRKPSNVSVEDYQGTLRDRQEVINWYRLEAGAAHYNGGISLFMDDQLEAAEKELSRVLVLGGSGLQPAELAKVYWILSFLYRRSGRFLASIQVAEKMRQLASEDNVLRGHALYEKALSLRRQASEDSDITSAMNISIEAIAAEAASLFSDAERDNLHIIIHHSLLNLGRVDDSINHLSATLVEKHSNRLECLLAGSRAIRAAQAKNWEECAAQSGKMESIAAGDSEIKDDNEIFEEDLGFVRSELLKAETHLTEIRRAHSQAAWTELISRAMGSEILSGRWVVELLNILPNWSEESIRQRWAEAGESVEAAAALLNGALPGGLGAQLVRLEELEINPLTNSDEVHAEVLRGRRLEALGQFERAIRVYGRITRSGLAEPVDISNFAKSYGLALTKSGEPLDQKAAALQRLWTAAKDSRSGQKQIMSFAMCDASIALGNLYLQAGDYEEAGSFYKQALGEWKKSKAADLVGIFSEKRLQQMALDLYQLGWSIPYERWTKKSKTPDLKIAIDRITQCQDDLFQFDQGNKELRSYVISKQALFIAKLAMCEPEKREQYTKKALDLASAALSISPESIFPVHVRAFVALNNEEWDNAIELYERIYARDQTEPSVRGSLARAHLQRAIATSGDFAAAHHWFDLADPKDPAVLYDHGRAFYHQAQYEKALQSWDALESEANHDLLETLHKDLARYHAYRFHALLQLKKWPEAAQVLGIVLGDIATNLETLARLALPGYAESLAALAAWISNHAALQISDPLLPQIQRLIEIATHPQRQAEMKAAFAVLETELTTIENHADDYASNHQRRSELGAWQERFDAALKKYDALLEDDTKTLHLDLQTRMDTVRQLIVEHDEHIKNQRAKQEHFEQQQAARKHQLAFSLLERKFADLATKPPDSWLQETTRQELDKWKAEVKAAHAARAALPAPMQTEVLTRESLLNAQLLELETRTAAHVKNVEKNNRLGVYGELNRQLMGFLRRPEIVTEAELERVEKSLENAKAGIPDWLLADAKIKEDELEVSIKKIRQAISDIQQKSETQQKYRLFTDRLQLLSSQCAQRWSEQAFVKNIDDLEEEFNTENDAFAKKVPSQAGILAGSETQFKKSVEALRQQIRSYKEQKRVAFRREVAALTKSLEAIAGYEDRKRLPALESQVKPLIERSAEWGDAHQEEMAQLDKALSGAQRRIIPKPKLGGELIWTLMNEGMGLPLYELIRILYAEPEGKWLLNLVEAAYPHLQLNRSVASAEVHVLVEALLPGEKFHALEKKFIQDHWPYIEFRDQGHRNRAELDKNLKETFLGVVSIALQQVQFSYWFSGTLKVLAGKASEEKKEMLADMGRRAEQIAGKPGMNFLFLSVGAQARSEAEANPEGALSQLLHGMQETFGDYLHAYDDYSIAFGLLLWTPTHKELFKEIQGRVETKWKTEDLNRAA